MLTSSSIVVSHGQSAADIKATATDASRKDSQPIFSWQWHKATFLSLSWLVLVSSSSSSTPYILSHCCSAVDRKNTAADASRQDQQPICSWNRHKPALLFLFLLWFLLLLLPLSLHILFHCCSAADGKTTASDVSRKDPQPICNWHSHAFAFLPSMMATSLSSIVVSHGQSAADIKATAADASQPIFSWQWHVATLLSLSWLVLVSSSTSYILSHCCSAADRKTTAADASREDPQPACRRPDCPLRLWWRRRQQGCWLESCTAAP